MAGLVDEQTCRRFSSGARRLPSFGNCRSSATLVDATMQTTSTDRTDNALSLLESNNTVRIVSPSPSLEDACTSTIDCNKIVRMVLTPSPSLEDSCTSSIDTRQENNTNESSLERETNAERTLSTFSQRQLSTHQYHPLQLWCKSSILVLWSRPNCIVCGFLICLLVLSLSAHIDFVMLVCVRAIQWTTLTHLFDLWLRVV